MAGTFTVIDDVPSPEHEIHGIALELQKRNPRDCAVILRTNSLVKEYSAALENYGISVVRKEYKDRPPDWDTCKALVALMSDPNNDMLAHWYLTRSCGRNAADVWKLKALSDFTTINALTLKLPRNIKVFECPDYLVRLGVGQESIALVHAAFSDLNAESTVSDLCFVLNQKDVSARETGEGVTVTTAHAAKGREWQTVFLAGMEQGLFPLKRGDLEEERRLAFVAVTRARAELFVSACVKRRAPFKDELEPRDASQFVKEMLAPG
jgi:ATP-dependent exoDNAse (exonuclease V) beta subunit